MKPLLTLEYALPKLCRLRRVDGKSIANRMLKAGPQKIGTFVVVRLQLLEHEGKRSAIYTTVSMKAEIDKQLNAPNNA